MPSLRDEGANLIVCNFRLERPDQVLAIVMGEAKVDFRPQRWRLDVADCGRVQIACRVNALIAEEISRCRHAKGRSAPLHAGAPTQLD